MVETIALASENTVEALVVILDGCAHSDHFLENEVCRALATGNGSKLLDHLVHYLPDRHHAQRG